MGYKIIPATFTEFLIRVPKRDLFRGTFFSLDTGRTGCINKSAVVEVDTFSKIVSIVLNGSVGTCNTDFNFRYKSERAAVRHIYLFFEELAEDENWKFVIPLNLECYGILYGDLLLDTLKNTIPCLNMFEALEAKTFYDHYITKNFDKVTSETLTRSIYRMMPRLASSIALYAMSKKSLQLSYFSHLLNSCKAPALPNSFKPLSFAEIKWDVNSSSDCEEYCTLTSSNNEDFRNQHTFIVNMENKTIKSCVCLDVEYGKETIFQHLNNLNYKNTLTYSTEKEAIEWMYSEKEKIAQLYSFRISIPSIILDIPREEWDAFIYPMLEDFYKKPSKNIIIHRELSQARSMLAEISANSRFSYEKEKLVFGYLVQTAPTVLEVIRSKYRNKRFFECECFRKVLLINTNSNNHV